MIKVILALIVLTSVIADAQIRKLSERSNYGSGSIEAGLAAEVGLNSFQRNTPAGLQYVFNYQNDQELYLNMNVFFGYYLLDGLSVEPELGLNLNFNRVTAMISGNICYTFNSESRTTYPYLRAGYGVTDFENNYNPSAGLFESLNYQVFIIGAGLKFSQSFNRALRLEINYKYISGRDQFGYYNWMDYSTTYPELETIMSIISLSVGYSFSL